MSPSMTPEQRQTQITRKEGLPKRYTKNPKQSIRPYAAFNGTSFVKVQSVIEHQTDGAGNVTHYKVVFDKSYGNQNTYTVPADLVFGVPPWGTEVKKMKVTPITEARDKGKKREVSPSGVAAQPPTKKHRLQTGANSSVARAEFTQNVKDAVSEPKSRGYGFCSLCFVWTPEFGEVAHILNSSLKVSMNAIAKAVRMHVINPLSEDDTATAARSFISDVKNALFLCVTCHRKMDGNAQSPASFFFCPPLFILEWILHEWIDDQQKPMADAIREAFPSGLHHYHVIPQMDYFNLHLPPPSVDLTGQEWSVGAYKPDTRYRICSRNNKTQLHEENFDDYPPVVHSLKKMDRDAKTAGPLLWDLEIVGIEHMLTALFWRFDDIIAMDVPKDKWYHQLLGVLIQIRHKLIQGAYDRAPEEQGPTGPASGNPSTGPQPGPPDSRDPPPGPPAPRDPSPGPSAPRDPPPTASGAAPDRAHDRDRHGSPTIWRVGGPSMVVRTQDLASGNYVQSDDEERDDEESDNEESDGASLPSVPTVDIPSWLSEVPQGEQCEDEHPGYAQQWQEHAHDGHRLVHSECRPECWPVILRYHPTNQAQGRRDETIVQIVARQFENSSSLFGAYGWEGTADKLGGSATGICFIKAGQRRTENHANEAYGVSRRCVSERQNAMLVDNDRVAVSCRLELPRSGTLRSALSRSFLDNLEENPDKSDALLLSHRNMGSPSVVSRSELLEIVSRVAYGSLTRTRRERAAAGCVERRREVADDIQGGQIVAFESS
ncbi:hypothetical protein C8F01DRAFT_1086310 [Mycena amicta]|nr:hypothetical protein C8F01DRAFT_1086310 [Mycena amicta]